MYKNRYIFDLGSLHSAIWFSYSRAPQNWFRNVWNRKIGKIRAVIYVSKGIIHESMVDLMDPKEEKKEARVVEGQNYMVLEDLLLLSIVSSLQTFSAIWWMS